MRSRRTLVLLVSLTSLLLSAPAAEATTYQILVNANTFDPYAAYGTPGDAFRWKNASSWTHRAYRSGVGAFDSANIAPAGTSLYKTTKYAGIYWYTCSLHSFPGSIRIAPTRSPATGGTPTTTFTLRFGTVVAPSGHKYDIQMRDAAGNWGLWTVQSAKTKAFTPGSAGTYSFRSRLRKVSGNAALGWSPPLTFTV